MKDSAPDPGYVYEMLKERLESLMQEGITDDVISYLKALAKKIITDSEDLQDEYVTTCSEKGRIFTLGEFMEILPERINAEDVVSPERSGKIIQWLIHAAAPPKVFVSYSHDSPEHKQWVLRLASKLRENGVDAVLDQWDCVPPMDVTRFMEDNLRDSKQVIIVCTELYIKKANLKSGGVGYERMIITAELARNLDTKKFIPIFARRTGAAPCPIHGLAYLY